MPDPPATNPLTRWLFETPWPLAAILVLIGVAFAVGARQTGSRRWIHIAIVCFSLAIAAFVIEWFVVTAGEHAARITRVLVEEAEEGDVAGVSALFSDDATMSLVSPANPGVGIDLIRQRIELLRGRYTIETNAITGLDTYSAERDAGVAHLHVRTNLEQGFGAPVFTSWVLRVERGADGEWRIGHLTFVKINDQTPTMDIFR